MPQFLLLEDIDSFLNMHVVDNRQVEFFKHKILSLGGTNESPRQKQFNSQDIYSLNANYGRYYHRLIFERASIDDRDVYILRSIAWAHDYDKATRFIPIRSITRTMLKKEYPNSGFIEASGFVGAVVHTNPDHTAITFKNKSLTLMDWQNNRLDNRCFPELNIGPPGSGKTLLALESLKENALLHQQNGHGLLKLLYLTHNEKLADSLKKEWVSWAKSHLFDDDSNPRVFAYFTTFKVLSTWAVEMQNTGIVDTSKHFKVIGQDTIKARFQNKLNTLQKGHELSVDLLYEELLLNTPYLRQDALKNKSFEQSSYQSRGTQQTLIKNEALKAQVYSILIHLLQQMDEQYEHHLGVSKLNSTDSAYQYDLVVVDEAQHATLTDIDNATSLAKNHQLLFLGDSFQKGHVKISALSLIDSHFKKNYRVTLNYQILPLTKRLTANNAKAINELVLLYGHLKGGKLDNLSYHSLPLSEQNSSQTDDFIRLMTAYDSKLQNFGANACAGTIVFCQEDKEKAKKMTHAPYVFEIGEAQGLEFSEVFLYLSEKTASKLLLLSQKMAEKGVKPGDVLKERTNNPLEKGVIDDGSFEMISNLIVGLSRSYGGNWVFIDHQNNKQLSHKLEAFIQWFQFIVNHHGHDTKASLQQLESKKSTRDEWLQRIDTFTQEGAVGAAMNALCNKLQYTEEQAMQYINDVSNPTLKSPVTRAKSESLPRPTSAAASRDTSPDNNAVESIAPQNPTPLKPLQKQSGKPEISDEQKAFEILIKQIVNVNYNQFKYIMNHISNGFYKAIFTWKNELGHALMQAILSTDKAQKNLLYYMIDNCKSLKDIVWLDIIGSAQKNLAQELVRDIQKLHKFAGLIKKSRLSHESLACIAAFENAFNLVDLLVAIDIDFNLPGKSGAPPACLAAEKGHTDFVAKLAAIKGRHSVNFNSTTKQGETPVFIAAKNGHIQVISALAKIDSSELIDFNKARDDGFTPLHIAVFEGRFNVVKQLLLLGANPDKVVNLSEQEIDKLIVTGNKSAKQRKAEFIQSAKQNSVFFIPVTAIDIAKMMGNTEIIGVIENAINNKVNSTPLGHNNPVFFHHTKKETTSPVETSQYVTTNSIP